MTNKQLKTRLEQATVRMGKERDRLRDLVSGIEELAEKYDSAMGDMESAIDTLSELA